MYNMFYFFKFEGTEKWFSKQLYTIFRYGLTFSNKNNVFKTLCKVNRNLYFSEQRDEVLMVVTFIK